MAVKNIFTAIFFCSNNKFIYTFVVRLKEPHLI